MIIKDIQDRISNKDTGWIFSAMDFADIANRNAIDQTLLRLTKKGLIQKVTTGLYNKPRINPKFGMVPPDIDIIAHALAKKSGCQIQVPPAQAANMLGLSQQVPTQTVYLTDGLSKVVKVGNQTLRFIHVSHKKMLGTGTKAGLVIQALYYFGKDGSNDPFLPVKIRGLLSDKDKNTLCGLMPRTPLWMQPILKKLLEDA